MAVVQCPECDKKFKIADAAAGKKVKCSCGNVFKPPVEEITSAAPPKKGPKAKVDENPPRPKKAQGRAPADSDEADDVATPAPKSNLRLLLIVGGGVMVVGLGLVFLVVAGWLYSGREDEERKALERNRELAERDAKAQQEARLAAEKPEQDRIARAKELAESARKDKPDFINSAGMRFVWVPPGNFMMGTPADDKVWSVHEPQHKVTLTKGFYLGIYTVTQEQWQDVMGSNPSFFKGEKNLPVENVSWDDCQAFIKKLRDKDKKPYRLPTEAEWEYACRGGTTTPFYFGATVAATQANYDANHVYASGVAGVYRQKTTPVGTFPGNIWGLHDMHGNVWQWCEDRFADMPQKDAVDPRGPDAGTMRVLRGGAWNYNPLYCRSAFRHKDEPGKRFNTYGCRLCFFAE